MFEEITQADIDSRSMANVSNTPGRRTPFGESGMDSHALKLRMDKLSRFLAKKINEILVGITDGRLAESLFISTDDKDGKVSLGELVKNLYGGDVENIKINAFGQTITLLDLAVRLLRIDNGIDSGDLAERMMMRDGESFGEFYDMAKSYVKNDHEAIAAIVLSHFTDVSEEGM